MASGDPAIPGSGSRDIAASPRVTVAPTHSPQRVNVSSGVSAGLLLAPIRPIYPRIAIATHTEGVVVVEAIISKSGKIESAHATSGSPMLRDAAVDAVRNARYSPYLLNGTPTEVDTTITVTFRLAS
jgi:protein TonB